MIEIEGLTKRFGATLAVDRLSLSVAPGEIYALLGPNGAGKSTTLSCLLGFTTPDAGTLRVDGVDVVAQPDLARRRIAYIPEQVSLYENFTGRENVAYFATLAGRRLDAGATAGLLAAAGLQPAAVDRRVDTYSKGMRQKVGIAIALAREATVMLLDEPTSGLDPAASHEFSLVLRSLRDRGVAILMATHDLFRTTQDADAIGILVGGRLVHERRHSALSVAEIEQLYVSALAPSAAA